MRYAVALSTLLLLGCGDDATISIEGKITVDGQPVTHGVINFLQSGGEPLGGGIQPDGGYAFEIPPGEYQVRIDAPPQIPDDWKEGTALPPLGPRLVPEKFANYSTSGLTLTVPEQSEPLVRDFALE